MAGSRLETGFTGKNSSDNISENNADLVVHFCLPWKQPAMADSGPADVSTDWLMFIGSTRQYHLQVLYPCTFRIILASVG